MMTLEQMIAMSGDESVSLRRNTGDQAPKGDPFTPGLAYAVEITESKPTKSKNGYDQLELAFSIIKSDGSLQRAGRHWESLPVFSDEVVAAQGEEKIESLRNIFGRNLLSLLRATSPDTFNVYATKQGEGKTAVYLDADGNRLTVADRNKREKAIEMAIVGAARAIREGKLDLAGKRIYVVKKLAANGKLYTNFFAEAPNKFPLAD